MDSHVMNNLIAKASQRLGIRTAALFARCALHQGLGMEHGKTWWCDYDRDHTILSPAVRAYMEEYCLGILAGRSGYV
jgi:hypothetical protein